jgi:glycosyltransferase 2 family protein
MPRTSDSGEVAVEDVRPPAVALGLRSVRSLRARLRPLAARVRPLVPLLRVLGFSGAVAIVAYMGFRAAREVKPDELAFWPLPLALLGAATWWLLLARGWALLLTGHSTRGDISTWCRTQALRFLPGGIWAPASRVTVVHGGTLDKLSTVAAENLLALSAAVAIGGVCLGAAGRPLFFALGPALAVPLVAARYLQKHSRIAPARTLTATGNYVLAFLAYGGAAILVQAAVSGDTHLAAVAGAGTIAWAAGLVVVIAPSGVGVREVAYVALLSGMFPEAELAAAAVTMRLIMIVAELVVLLVAGRPPQPAAAGPAPAAPPATEAEGP